WARLFHLSRAEETAPLLQEATPERFRTQLLAFRPIDAIRGDIETALRAAIAARHVVAVARLFLCRGEFVARADALESHPIVEQLLVIGESDLASAHARDGLR